MRPALRLGSPGRHRWLVVALALLAAVFVLWALGWISREMTRDFLRQQAGQRLWVAEYGDPLWSWDLQQPRDLVAQRVFGHARLTTTGDGLRVTSIDGTPFELGLPVRAPMDVQHWPLLQWVMHASEPAQVQVVWQSTPEAPLCTSPDPLTVSPDEPMLALPLDELDARQADGHPCPRPTVVAWLLRLRVTLPTNATLDLRRAALISRAPVPTPKRHYEFAGLSAQDLRNLAPLTQVRLPESLGPEGWLGARDALLQQAPSAVVIVGDDPLAPRSATSSSTLLPAAVCAVYLMLLLWLAWRPRPHWELPALLFGMLWLIAGLQWGQAGSRPAALAFAAAVGFAVWREWRTRPHSWQWLSRRPAAWIAPLALVPVAILLACAYGQAWTAPPWRHAGLYLGWAALQQWLMLAVVLPRLAAWRLPAAASVLGTALVFALLHTPNGHVMQLCFLAELVWAGCFLRWRALAPLAVAHAACALIVEAGLTGPLLRSLEVSARFFF